MPKSHRHPDGILRFAVLASLAGLAPVIGAVVALPLARLANCAPEGDLVRSCSLAGLDVTLLIDGLLFAHWFVLLSWPLLLAGLGAFAVLGLERLALAWKRRPS